MGATERNPWRWYYGFGHGKDCEGFFTAADRADAIAQAEAGCMPGDPYCIGEARHAEPSLKIFRADEVLDAFDERNDECWGEDGAEINTTPDQDRELEQMLADSFAAWAEKHGHPWRVWSLEYWRNQEDREAPRPHAGEKA